MSNNNAREMRLMFFPYAFVLKEGPDFSENMFNYQLMIVQVSNETIKAPPGRKMDVHSSNKSQESLNDALPRAIAKIRDSGTL
jgi:hypothetical protein